MAIASATSLRSRRALLAGAIGAAAASVASALGRPTSVRAGTDGDIVLGANPANYNGTGTNETTLGTGIYTTQGFGLRAETDGGSDSALIGSAYGSGTTVGVRGFVSSTSGTAIYGHANALSGETIGVLGDCYSEDPLARGVYGGAPNGRGVDGHSETAIGVHGDSLGTGTSAVGVHGEAYNGIGLAGWSQNLVGTVGQSSVGTGVLGHSGTGAVPNPPDNVGVYGYATNGTGARAIFGRTMSGTALYGTATLAAGYALKTSGRLSFAKVSGVAVLAAGNTSITVPVATDVTSASYVLLTPQGDPGSRRLWATKNTGTNEITIRSNVSAGTALSVAWLLVN